ncbi:calcineurin subunit B-like [Drosophila innubila]|uniref:calcineurin subunit B-like n=1 Tax=Drosophila innubila TaxID=198719 RepID=UPI00148BA251|nr:calcineurin subunit B-like [Drosophila innubila]
MASRHLSADQLNQIQFESGFSTFRIDYLLGQYESLDRDGEGRVLRSELLKVPPIAAHPLADRLVDVYLHPSHGFRHFIYGLSRFRRSESLELKLQSLLQMFDSDGNGILNENQCNELLLCLPATRHELRSMRWKLKQLMAAQLMETKDIPLDVGYINCQDLAYITRDVDLDQTLSLRFD